VKEETFTFITKTVQKVSKKSIFIEDRGVREEIPVHLFEDYELESKKVEEKQYLKRLEENERYWSVCNRLATG
jgi:hypothetical protein